MVDMYDYQKRYQRAVTNLWKSTICREDKNGIEQFLRDLKSRGIGYARLIKLYGALRILGKHLNKPFEKATINDIKKVVHHYETGDYTFWSKHDTKVILKQYYAWLNKGTYPKKVAWICTTIPKKEKRITNDSNLLTIEEIKTLIETADHPRNKALISILAESGARIGEIGNLTIRQISIDPNGIVLNLEGKTGSRRIRIINATPHITTWLNNHPDKQNSSAPVWTNIGPRRYHAAMTYEAIRKVIIQTFKKAGIKKPCYPYIFRHTRACQLAHHLTEFQMNTYFGWLQGSQMPGTYIHISGKDLDEHIIRINGLKPSETPIYGKPQNRICPRCNNINSQTDLYCGKCAEIVDPALALKIQMQEVEKPVKHIKTPFMEWLQKDPELRDILKKKVTEFRTETTQQTT